MRILRISLLSTVALSALIAPDTAAQNEIGFGAFKRAFNMTELSGSLPDTLPDQGIFDVVEIGGLLYVSGRNGAFDSDTDHKVYIVDPGAETLLGSFSIPEPHQSSDAGAHGLAVDLAGNILASGHEGVSCFDTAGNVVSTVLGNNGPIEMPVIDSVPRVPIVTGILSLFFIPDTWAMAFDPAGDRGNGSFIVGESTNAYPFLELSTSSGEILKWVNDGGGASIDSQGLVLDPERGTLWTNSSGDFGGGPGLYELDWENLTPLGGTTRPEYSIEATGRFIEAAPIQPGLDRRSFGGLGVMPGGDARSPWPASFDLVSVSRQSSFDFSRGDDFIAFHRLHQFPGVPGDTESYLAVARADRNGANQTPFLATDSLLVRPGERMYLQMISNGRPNAGGPIGMVLFNLPISANAGGITPLLPLGLPGNFPELVALSPFSVPPDPVGTAVLFGGQIDTQIQASPNSGIPPLFQSGDRFNAQVLYFEPSSPLFQLAASNQAGFSYLDTRRIELRIEGPSAFSVDLLDPFIQLRESGGGDASTSITKLILSTKNADAFGAIRGAVSALGTSGTGSTLPPGVHFDINQGGMADRFIAGSGDLLDPIIVGCSGTYRPIDPGGDPFTSVAPRSDVDVGLIYGDGLIDPAVNTPYNLGRGDPDFLDPDTQLPAPIPPPIDASASPPYHPDAAMLTAYGLGNLECFFEWWPQPPSTTAYPYQTGFVAGDGEFGLDAGGIEQPGYNAADPDSQGTWLFWPQTLEFHFTAGAFLGKTFGFDLDLDGTDDLGGDSGGDLAGLFVEVHLADGTVFSGLTLPDVANPNASFIGW